MTRTDNWLEDLLESVNTDEEDRAAAIAQAAAAIEALRAAKAMLAAAAAAIGRADTGRSWEPMAQLSDLLEDASSVDIDELDAQLSNI